MTSSTEHPGGKSPMPWRLLGWGGGALLLSALLAAGHFSPEMNWNLADFLFVGVLVAGVGGLAELTVRTSRNAYHRAGIACALAAAVLIVVASGAVGMIGSEDDAYNLLFLGVIGLALLGAVLARFRARRLSLVTAAAALAHAAVAVSGVTTDARGALFSLALAVPWLLSAALFRQAAKSRHA